MKKVLTTFSKSIKDSRGLSFSRSASLNCDKGCAQFNKGCYAEKVEKRYKDYGIKLLRHARIPPHNLIYRALDEVVRLPKLKWFRVSVSGSIPPKSRIKNFAAFSSALRELIYNLTANGVKIHIPVESYPKATMVRSILGGLPVIVRRSCQSLAGLKRAKDHASFVVPKTMNYDDLSHELRSMGKSVVVCPAIIGDSKCGKCTACSSKFVDIILYPKH